MVDVPEGAARRLGEFTWCVESTPEGSANAGLVIGARAVMFVDTRLTPAFGRALRALGDSLGPGRPRFAALTHYHGDHTFGAGELGEAVFISSAWTRVALAERWEEQLKIFNELRPELAGELARARRVQPHVVSDGPLELDLGGVRAELRPIGPAHTPGDFVVRVPADDVVFAGDVVFNGHWPVFWDADPATWLDVLGGEAVRAGTVVPGHGPAGGSELVDRMAECLQLLDRQATGQAAADPTASGPFRDWLHPDRVAEAVRYIARESDAAVVER